MNISVELKKKKKKASDLVDNSHVIGILSRALERQKLLQAITSVFVCGNLHNVTVFCFDRFVEISLHHS